MNEDIVVIMDACAGKPLAVAQGYDEALRWCRLDIDARRNTGMAPAAYQFERVPMVTSP